MSSTGGARRTSRPRRSGRSADSLRRGRRVHVRLRPVRRVVVQEFGPLENLTIEDVPALEPGPGQVVVDVKAAGVNFVDALFIQGRYQIKPPTPFVPGSDIAGVVSGVGEGVE